MQHDIATTAEIIEELRQGRMVVLVDAPDRENEGDLVMAADFVTPEAINFMARHARGLICLTLEAERCRQLNLPLMVSDNRTPHGTAFTVSIEAATGVTTGISAADRARTVQAAVAPNAMPGDLVQPGHVFPVRARDGGVLVRAGHTEAGCDLARLAGRTPAAVICEIIKDDGEMARMPDLMVFAKQHGLKIGTIEDLIRHRSITETLVEKLGARPVATPYGEFMLHAFHDRTADEVHLALTRGDIDPERPVLTRVHEPFTSLDLFEADPGRHAYSVAEALRVIAMEGTGVLVLLRRAETADSIRARFSAEPAPRAAKWDERTFGIGAQILKQLNARKLIVMAKPRKLPSMAGFDLDVVDYLPPDERKLKAV